MSDIKVLHIMHNHPRILPGGAEGYAYELYQGLQQRTGFDPLLLARIGSNVSVKRQGHPGAPFSMLGDDPGQYLVFTEPEHFDFFLLTSKQKTLHSRDFAEFLEAHRPDVVHFQHTLFIGCEAVTQVKRTLPGVPIVYTLHEYLPICHRDGQMVRTLNNELCNEASPRRCNECFPLISPQNFFLRERFIKSHFSEVDQFIAPSKFLQSRYIDWGIPAEKIQFEDYGRLPVIAAKHNKQRKVKRLAFFGQLNPFKGVLTLLKAMKILADENYDAQLTVYGANVEIQSPEFQEEFHRLLAETRDSVTFAGKYAPTDLSVLMEDVDWVVIPSVWWENSSLVIQEAFLHKRPIICSDIGGMAEKVTDEVDGLHFRARHPASLAEVIKRATSDPRLWRRLQGNISEILPMDRHIDNLERIYERLLENARVPA